jgi:hypothetical protein
MLALHPLYTDRIRAEATHRIVRRGGACSPSSRPTLEGTRQEPGVGAGGDWRQDSRRQDSWRPQPRRAHMHSLTEAGGRPPEFARLAMVHSAAPPEGSRAGVARLAEVATVSESSRPTMAHLRELAGDAVVGQGLASRQPRARVAREGARTADKGLTSDQRWATQRPRAGSRGRVPSGVATEKNVKERTNEPFFQLKTGMMGNFYQPH